MTKFGKLVLAVLILGAIFILPVAADWEPVEIKPVTAFEAEIGWTKKALQDLYLDKIAQEGFRPDVDGDGDIQFRVLGSNYFVIIDENDLEFFQIYTGFWLDTITMDEAYEIVNFANRRSKVAKISLSSPDDDSEKVVVSITAELLVENPEDFAPIFTRAISLLANARNIFQTLLQAHQAELAVGGR